MAELMTPTAQFDDLPSEGLPAVVDTAEQLAAATEERGRLLRTLHAAKRSGQVAIALAELSPVNEAIRLSAFAAGETMSHNPAVGALTFGLSTLAVEGSAAVASASLFNTETSRRFNDFLKTKMKKLGYSEDKKLSRYSKVAGTFLGGSVVGMALENFDDADRTTKENVRFGLITSAWLAGACAVQGALMAEGVDASLDHPVTAGAIVGSAGAVAAGRYAWRKIKRNRSKTDDSVEEIKE